MELLNCGWGLKVSKGKNQKQKNEVCGLVKVAKKTH